MKTIKIISLPLIAFMVGFASCQKEDMGTPVLTPSETTVLVNQEVTITLSGVGTSRHGYTASNAWTKVSGPDFKS